jgi:hypothetical protein
VEIVNRFRERFNRNGILREGGALVSDDPKKRRPDREAAPPEEVSGLDRRNALKVLGAAAAIQAAPRNWKKPFTSMGSAPAFAQGTALGTGDLQVTLTWDTDFSDCDLYVLEPDSTWVYYGNDIGPTATLDADDTEGFGPENIFVPPGNAANGTYSAAIDMFDLDGITTNTNCTIQVRTFVDTPGQQSQTFNRVLTPADESGGSLGFWVADIVFPSGNISNRTGTVGLPRQPRAPKGS